MATHSLIKIDPKLNPSKAKELEFAVDETLDDGTEIIKCHDLESKGEFLFGVHTNTNRRIVVPSDIVLSVKDNPLK